MLSTAGPRAWSAASFESCAKEITQRPAEYESYRCYYEVASSSGEWAAAGRQLDILAAAHPQSDWIIFVRALVTWPLDKSAAERLYLEAARRFDASGNIRGEVLARANLHTLFYESGRVGSAAREVERVTALAERAQDPELRIRARIVEAQFFIITGTNLGRAQRALQQAEAELDAMPTYWLRHHVLHGLGNVLSLIGQYDEAVTYFRRLQEEARVQKDLSTEALARLSIVNTLAEKRSDAPQSVDAVELFAAADQALRAARQAQDVDLELNALRLLGEVSMAEHVERASGYVDECVHKAQSQRRSQALSQCLWIRGRLLAASDPAAAQRAIDAAIGLLQHEEGTDDAMLAYAWRHAMRIAWQTQPPEAAVRSGAQALSAIEHLRDLQPGLDSRAAAFSTWTQDYYWLSGQILRLATGASLQPHPARARALLDEAFQVGERMRARSLLDRLKAPPRSLADVDDATLQRRRKLSKSIVEVNRQLLQSNGHANAEQLRMLAALERAEADTREAQDAPHVTMHPVSLAAVQQRLASDEALLAFQIGLRQGSTDRYGGGAWLFAVTRAQAYVRELPDRYTLTQSLALFKGLIHQSPALRTRAGIALYDQLLRPTLEALPKGIRRLIIVPDAPLDTFPLAALSSARDEPLATRYEMVLVPSATIWHDWRNNSAPVDARAVLVLADPQLELASNEVSPWRYWVQDAGLSLGQLPHARDEGREIVQRLPGHGMLWTGKNASEAALKTADLSRYGLLHFATHTIVDSSNANRSAILLASGTSEEDGLLQSREISDLKLGGHVVVLSSCQSATGAQVRGEGVLGLARAFFAAGARAVIGSLWPIRDDHAQAFFDPFYAALSEGHTVNAAFRRAQRQLMDQGYPMEAWAGFVLMGDAATTLTDKPDGAGGNRRKALAIVAVVGTLGLAMWFTTCVHRKRQQTRYRT
ncbi:MAG: CHAT domain-containing protein [Steroidobacteraceae bacterium]